MASLLQRFRNTFLHMPTVAFGERRRYDCGLLHDRPPRLIRPPESKITAPSRREGPRVAALHNERFVNLMKQRPWIREVAIQLEDDPCPPCAREDKFVPTDLLPFLPHLLCKRPEGCGCWYGVPAHARANLVHSAAVAATARRLPR